MTKTGTFGDFLAAVEELRDGGPVRLTAHTSSVSADAWTAPAQDAPETPATPTASAS
ncbi:hypothetical protein [Streptomyces sp. NPDC056291]|uniref:hypothetical protein n=1 Tax=Streptomyces sp. NPDC056291 TaxID=3345772 RepID=UPI0035D99B26